MARVLVVGDVGRDAALSALIDEVTCVVALVRA
jgi:hypothetical protein